MRLSIPLILLILTSSLRAAGDKDSISPGDVLHSPNTRQPDLSVQLPIKATDEYTQYKAGVPDFELAGARLKAPNGDTTRLMVGLRFTSRSVQSAHLDITLLNDWKETKPLHRLSHVEKLGPEEVKGKRKTLEVVQHWNDSRALWFDLPADVANAEAIQVQVYLMREERR
jgi:hypothetical protein